MKPPSLSGLVGTWIALLVVVVFMRLAKSAPMVVVVALVAAFDLAILVVLSLPDFAVRGW